MNDNQTCDQSTDLVLTAMTSLSDAWLQWLTSFSPADMTQLLETDLTQFLETEDSRTCYKL